MKLLRRFSLLVAMAVAIATVGLAATAAAGPVGPPYKQTQVPGVSTPTSPAEVYDSVSNQLWYAFSENGNVYIGPSTTTSFTGPDAWIQITGANSNLKPGITTTSDGTLWVAWTDATTGDVDVAGCLLGCGAAATVGGGTGSSAHGPSICSDGTNLYVAYSGRTTDNVHVSENDGNASDPWSGNLDVPGADTTTPPAISCDGSGDGGVAWTTPIPAATKKNKHPGGDVETEAFTPSSSLSLASFTGSPSQVPDAVTNAGPGCDNCESVNAVGEADFSYNVTIYFKGLTTDKIIYSSLVCTGMSSGSLNCDKDGWSGLKSMPTAKTANGPAVADWSVDVGDCTPESNTTFLYSGKTPEKTSPTTYHLYSLSASTCNKIGGPRL